MTACQDSYFLTQRESSVSYNLTFGVILTNRAGLMPQGWLTPVLSGMVKSCKNNGVREICPAFES